MLPILVHEAEPGHHYQLTLQANAHIPDFRRYIQFGHYGQVPYNWPLFTSYIEVKAFPGLAKGTDSLD